MKKLNTSQRVGILLFVLGLLIYFLTSHTAFGIMSGVLCGMGISFIFLIDAEKTIQKIKSKFS